MNRFKPVAAAALAALIVAFFVLGGHRYLTFDSIKSQQAAVHALYERNPLSTAIAFFAAYVAVTGLSLPGAAVMTLAAGAMFGLAWGTVLVSFASSIGATLAFLVSRLLQMMDDQSHRATNLL